MNTFLGTGVENFCMNIIFFLPRSKMALAITIFLFVVTNISFSQQNKFSISISQLKVKHDWDDYKDNCGTILEDKGADTVLYQYSRNIFFDSIKFSPNGEICLWDSLYRITFIYDKANHVFKSFNFNYRYIVNTQVKIDDKIDLAMKNIPVSESATVYAVALKNVDMNKYNLSLIDSQWALPSLQSHNFRKWSSLIMENNFASLSIAIPKDYVLGVGPDTKSEFEVYPSVSSSQIQINLPQQSGIKGIHIVDELGRIVKQIILENSERKVIVDVSQFVSGKYFVTLGNVVREIYRIK
jgi:hypothetical protein